MNGRYFDKEKKCCSVCGLWTTEEGFKTHTDGECFIIEMKNRQVQESIKKEGEMENKQEITVVQARDVAPTLVGTLEETEKRYKQLQEFVQKQMVEGEDFGKIPGCPKPSLFKAGAEKLLEIYGYAVSDIQTVNKIEDFEKGFFHYEVKATAVSKRSGQVVGVGVGSCNSKEKKYINQDPYTLVNTLMKMAKKRAVVDLALLVTRSSGIFTQDVEDIEPNGITPPAKKQSPVVKHEAAEKVNPDGSTTVEYDEIPANGSTEKQQKCIYAVCKGQGMDDKQLEQMLFDEYGVKHTRSLTKAQASELIDRLQGGK